MLHKVKASHRDILKGLPELAALMPSSSRNKRILLDMARRGEPRPNTMKTKIGSKLTHYTNPNSGCYDPKFDRDIRKLRPDWFVSKSDRANQKKAKLFEMARKGESKPHHRTKMGSALIHYTLKKSSSYDPKFDREIRKARPDWFVSQFDIAKQKKKQLLKMAKKGSPKPVWGRHPLGIVFKQYTSKKGSCYDPVFTKEIRLLRPDWFIPQRVQNAMQRKKRLIEMAKRGDSRPEPKTKLGYSLCEYLRKNGVSFDPDFSKKIRRLRLDWFVSEQTKGATQKKNLLLEMAKKKKPRPNARTKLGCALCQYLRRERGSYDPNFDKTIRKLAPHWFVSKSDIASKKKSRLLEIAKRGGPRPNTMKTKIGANLTSYTNPNKSSYDPDFTKEIKRLAPHWFVSRSETANQKKMLIVEMARRGEPKPKRDSPLGVMFPKYTSEKSGSYDPKFTREIKRLAPHWFRKATL